MNIQKSGIILYTIKYSECVNFYENTLQLPKLFETDELTCFDFGYSYLMVELDNDFKGEINERITTCLRFNVENVKEMADKLIAKDIEVNYQEYEWGTIAKFSDPDGNLCALKDSETFDKQIENFKIRK